MTTPATIDQTELELELESYKNDKETYKAFHERYIWCVFPECGKPYPHAHHIKYRSQGGETTLKNLIPLCGEHHDGSHGKGRSPIKVHHSNNGSAIIFDADDEPLYEFNFKPHHKSELDGTTAYNLNEEVKALAKVFHSSGLELGEKLHHIYTEKIYEALDYESFNAYVSGELPIGKAQAYRVKSIAAQSERLELPEGALDGIAVDKLALVLPMANSGTVKSFLERARFTSYSDLKAEVRGEPEHNFTAENACLKCDKSCCQQHRNYGG